MTPIARTGGRVLIVDAARRLLLIHERLEDGRTHWLTPGGGVEGDEHPREAARREAFEETGIAVDLAPDAEPVHVTRREWNWGEQVFDQIDHFFVARVADGTSPHPRQLTDIERQTWIAFRWWTAAELDATDQVLVPADLGAVLRRVLGMGATG